MTHASKYNQFINNLIFVIRTYAICIAINVRFKANCSNLDTLTTERKERMKKRGMVIEYLGVPTRDGQK